MMGCACSGSAQSPAGRQQATTSGTGNRSAYEFEVTYNDGGTRRFPTEVEAIAALSSRGGGYRQVQR